MQTNIEDNLIALFWDQGFTKNQNLTQHMLRKVFNTRSEAEFNTPFKYDMLNEIINECRNSKLQLTPKSVAQVVSSAYRILNERLDLLNNENGLIQQHIQALNKLQIQRGDLDAVPVKGYYQTNLINQIQKSHEKLYQSLSQLNSDKKQFQEQLQIITSLFLNYTHKKTRLKTAQKPEPTARRIQIIFYIALIGTIIQLMIVSLRPCFLSLLIYLQALFVVLIGYINKKSVMLITLTGLLSLGLDGLAVGLYVMKVVGGGGVGGVVGDLQKGGVIVSILLRILLLISSYILIQPPIRKIPYSICNHQLTLNLRLKIGTA